MSLPIVFLPEARAEFDEAANWYEQRARRGTEFTDCVRDVVNRIAANPQLHQVIDQDVRRAVVSHFPYTVLYRDEPGQIIIIAVFHSRRNPRVWQARL